MKIIKWYFQCTGYMWVALNSTKSFYRRADQNVVTGSTKNRHWGHIWFKVPKIDIEGIYDLKYAVTLGHILGLMCSRFICFMAKRSCKQRYNHWRSYARLAKVMDVVQLPLSSFTFQSDSVWSSANDVILVSVLEYFME